MRRTPADRLRRILADVLGVDPATLSDESSAETAPEWTSLAHVNLVLTLEAEFGVSFDPEEVLEMTSLAAIERSVRAKTGDQRSGDHKSLRAPS